jgi:hypothetical protein
VINELSELLGDIQGKKKNDTTVLAMRDFECDTIVTKHVTSFIRGSISTIIRESCGLLHVLID